MALNPVDRLLAGYLVFVTAVIVARGPITSPDDLAMLLMHGAFAVLLLLFTRLRPTHRLGHALHTLYPLILLLPFYAQIGLLNGQVDSSVVYAHDATVQRLEAAVFGGQISYTVIREYPSVFWSGLLHLAYFAYYPIVILGPVVLWLRGRPDGARAVVLTTMIAFVICYVWFILYPVAGPNYTFDHPTGPVRTVWSAELVYAVLEGGSSFGAAFPSSHVGATVAATLALWREWRPVGQLFTLPAVLLTVGTVYCQMHYGVDAAAGLAVGVGAYVLSYRWLMHRGKTRGAATAAASTVTAGAPR